MVAIITALNLEPTAETARLAEQLTAVFLFVGIGGLLGGVLAFSGQRRPERLVIYGLQGGLMVFVIAVLTEILASTPASSLFLGVLWLAAVFVAWGHRRPQLFLPGLDNVSGSISFSCIQVYGHCPGFMLE